jgi:hypothetical protein
MAFNKFLPYLFSGSCTSLLILINDHLIDPNLITHSLRAVTRLKTLLKQPPTIQHIEHWIPQGRMLQTTMTAPTKPEQFDPPSP